MSKNLFVTVSQKINDWIFFLGLVLYQLLFIFQGLDFADEGFYATFYQQIFNNPQSVSFNFMYWLSGILGGAYYFLFPDLGLLGLRILGIIVITSTIAVVYFSLKKYLNQGYLRIGIFLILFFISNDPKEMYYNNLSSFLFFLSAITMFNGLKDKIIFKIFISGALVSLNMFTRTPSIVGLSFILAIPYFGYISDISYRNQLKQGSFYLLGFISTTAFILLIMKSIGHLKLFIENLEVVFGMGTQTESVNNITKLIKLFSSDYSNSLIYGFILISSIFILSYANNLVSDLTKYKQKKIVNLSFSLILLICIYFTISHKITWSGLLWIFTGLSLIISILIVSTKSFKNEIKLLTVLGCLVLLIAPFGSGGGIYMVGRYSLWIIFPITIDYIFNLKLIETKINISSNGQGNSLNFSISEEQIRLIRSYLLGLSVFICLYFAYHFPYFDMSDRTKMRFMVENKNVKGIFTTKERAQVINELLKESSKYLKKDDYLLAYDNIPMIHFLTETKPYIHNSWPYFFIPEAFKKEMNKSIISSKELPVVILQKVNTLYSDWPLNSIGSLQKLKSDIIRDSIMFDFMEKNKYVKVWENKAFEIRVPDKHL